MRSVLAALALAAVLAVPADGQEAQTQEKNPRHGFWFSGGLGWGSVGVTCDACSDDRVNGFSGNVRMGGTLGGGRFLLGGETNGWYHSESGVTQNMGFLSFVFVWYPARTGAFFLKFGLGGMYYRADDGFDELTATAPSGSFGLGYDIRVARNLSLTPYVNGLATSKIEARINGTSIPGLDVTTNLFQFGLALSVH